MRGGSGGSATARGGEKSPRGPRWATAGHYELYTKLGESGEGTKKIELGNDLAVGNLSDYGYYGAARCIHERIDLPERGSPAVVSAPSAPRPELARCLVTLVPTF